MFFSEDLGLPSWNLHGTSQIPDFSEEISEEIFYFVLPIYVCI